MLIYDCVTVYSCKSGNDICQMHLIKGSTSDMWHSRICLRSFNKALVNIITRESCLLLPFWKHHAALRRDRGSNMRNIRPHSPSVHKLFWMPSGYKQLWNKLKPFRLSTWQRDGVFLPASLQTAARSAPTYPCAASASCVSSSAVALHGTELSCFCKMSARSAAPGTPTCHHKKQQKVEFTLKLLLAEQQKKTWGAQTKDGLCSVFQQFDLCYQCPQTLIIFPASQKAKKRVMMGNNRGKHILIQDSLLTTHFSVRVCVCVW